MAYEYLESLNPEQRQAVEHTGSPLLILAGAGSGKTRVITTKIAYLIQHESIEPWQILAVTFTKKAANEMRERALSLEPKAVDTQIKTFHSFGAWFLRRYYESAYISKSFTVYDDTDSAALLKNAVPELTKKQAAIAAKKIALCKDYCLGPEDELGRIDEDGDLAKIYSAYQERLRKTGNVDFGDLIMLPVKLLESNPNLRKQMQHRFKVIMVDEYQDSNVAQFRLLNALSGTDEGSKTYVCVVGDDDQSIYKFRGAEIQNILQFPTIFSGTTLIRLERNYRSTEKILEAANAVVSHNQDRLGKNLIAEKGKGTKPALIFLENQDMEAKLCTAIIKKAVECKNATSRYSDFAILYRTNAQSMEFEQEFLRSKIPYKVVGSLKFYEREEVKDTLAYLSLIANRKDEVAFQRIANKPVRGIGEKSQEKIIAAFHGVKKEQNEDADIINAAEELVQELPKKAGEGVKEFSRIIKNLGEQLEESSKEASDAAEKEDNHVAPPLSLFINHLVEETGLFEYHKAKDDVDGSSKVENMEELANYAAKFPCTIQGLIDFLDTINLDRVLSDGMNDEADSVTLITLHNTKGLEFERVIITGLENGIFPREDKIGSDLEEERRLFYVGITRAKKELTVTSCKTRRLYGRFQEMMPSIFIKEAENAFDIQGVRPETESEKHYFSNPNSILADKFKKGTKIFHDDYGYGIVESINNSGQDIVISVRFETGSSKKFIPKYQSKSLQVIKD